MPNWCENELTVTGDANIVAKLVEFVKGEPYEGQETPLDFNKVIPYPKEYADMDAEGSSKGFNAGGYEWCWTHWGTKWNACETAYDEIENGVRYFFDTAWSPSILITQELARAFPELTFKHKFCEAGADFSGFIVCADGEVVNSGDGDYNAYSKNARHYGAF